MFLWIFNSMCLYVGMCRWMQVPLEARRGCGSPGAGVTGTCESHDRSSGSHTLGPLQSGVCPLPGAISPAHRGPFKLYLPLLFVVGCFRWDGVSLCSPGYLRTHSVDQAGLTQRSPASVSRVLGLKTCTTPAQLINIILIARTQELPKITRELVSDLF